MKKKVKKQEEIKGKYAEHLVCHAKDAMVRYKHFFSK